MFEGKPLANKAFSSLIHPEDRPVYFSCLEKVQRLNRASCELRLLGKDNGVIHTLMEASADHYKGGGSFYWRFAFNDITRQKKAEAELKKAYDELERRVKERTLELDDANALLRQSEKKLAAELDIARLLQQLSTKLIQADEIDSLYEQILDTAKTIMQSDFASIQMFDPERGSEGELRLLYHRGFSPEAAGHWKWVGPASSSVCGEAMRTGQRVVVPDVRKCDFMAGSVDLDILLRAGILSVQTTPLLSRNGALMGMLSTQWREPRQLETRERRALDVLARMAADLIERKRSEETLQQLNESLEQKVAERTQLAEERARKLQTLVRELTLAEQRERQRIATILHDHLQQLLVGAKINGEVLSARTNDDQKELTENILNLINQSIQTSRTLTAELSPPVLQAGISAALEWLGRWMKEKHGFEVELQVNSNIDPQREDTTILLFQSARELIFNVIKHAGVRSARLEMVDSQEQLRLTISDDGSGFDPAAVWKMESTGFGLLSIRERLEQMGGSLRIDSAPGKGASISLIVPLETRAERDEEDIRKIISNIQKAKKHGEKIRVLLVDDHTVVRQGLSTMLNLHSDVEVIGEAANGEEAVEKARELQPDVILMDISMPKMDGIEATRIIKSEFPQIRIIGLSMHEKQDQAARMIEAGASPYCTKDGETDKLLTEIRGGGST